MKIRKPLQCAAIIQPGEYTIDRWDNTQCTENKPHLLVKCPECGNDYCLYSHWGKHKECKGKPG